MPCRIPHSFQCTHIHFLKDLEGSFLMAPTYFFRAKLDAMINPRHPLAVLATRMPWAGIESALASCFSRQDRQGRRVEG